MVNMQTLLRKNYSEHPQFRFNQAPLKAPLGSILEFNSSHGSSRDKLNKSGFQKVLTSLSGVFEELRSQSSDPDLKLFLDELEFEMKEYLKKEFVFRKNLMPKVLDGNEMVESLSSDDHFFGHLSAESVARIQEIAAPSVARFRKNASSGKLKRTDLSVDSGPIPKRISKIIDKEFREKGIFSAVSNYVGINYAFTGCSLELSSEGSTWWKDSLSNSTPPKTMYAHLDETIYAPKSIVYLSNVASDNGPTTCFPGAYRKFKNSPLQDVLGRVVGRVGSSKDSPLYALYKKAYHQSTNSALFREHFMMLPDEMRFNSHFGWDVESGSDLETALADIEIEMLGKAGKFIVFDGSNLLHRGGLIEKGERLVLQVVFYPGNRITHRLRAVTSVIATKLKKVQ